MEEKDQQMLFEKLTELGIDYKTYAHEAVFTCEQAAKAASFIPAAQCKNLFLKDDKKRLYLVVAVSDTAYETNINLKGLSKHLHAPGLRFADAVLLKHHLHIEPGSVTPFGLIFDTEHKITVLLDSMLFSHQFVGFHPLKNVATTVIASQDILKFVEACGNSYLIVDFTKII